MRQLTYNKAKRGFTLVELAIVLAVAAVLFAGLWRLIAGGNDQVRDQAAADMQKQVIGAVEAYLVDPAVGAPFLTTTNGTGNKTSPLTLSALSTAGYLPPTISTNAYGQSYNIIVSAPTSTTYSFLVYTSGGSAIPDTSGGRISSLIGGDGGFIYSTPVCDSTGTAGGTTSNNACGAYGGWAIDVTVSPYFLTVGAATTGHVVSRSYPNLATFNAPWLARIPVAGDTTVGTPPTPDHNTMQTSLYLQSSTASASSIYLQGNTLFGGGVAGDVNGLIQNVTSINAGDSNSATLNSGLTVVGNSNRVGFIVNGPSYVLKTDPYGPNCGTGGGGGANIGIGSVGDCQYIAEINGNTSVTGILTANALYAASFVYDTSDMRLKKNIKPIIDPLENLGKLNAVSFVRIDGNRPGLGVIAQDVEKVYPELVTDIGKGYKGVDYIGFVGPLIGAVQELKAQNDVLRKQIQNLTDLVNRKQNKN